MESNRTKVFLDANMQNTLTLMGITVSYDQLLINYYLTFFIAKGDLATKKTVPSLW